MWSTFPAASVLVYRLPSSLFSALNTFVKRLFLFGSGSALAPTTVTVVGQPLSVVVPETNKNPSGEAATPRRYDFQAPKEKGLSLLLDWLLPCCLCEALLTFTYRRTRVLLAVLGPGAPVE
jgi:hypothetical protein